MPENKRVLIVRSASFQQLDNNLAAILAHFKDWDLHLLTHEHGRRLAEKYKDFSAILVYPYPGPFQRNAAIPDLPSRKYDAVLVLVANLSGAGFANVFDFASSLGAAGLYRCNLVGDIRSLQPSDLAAGKRRDIFCRLCGTIFGTVLGLACAVWFTLSLPVGKLISPLRKEKDNRSVP